MMRQSIVGLAKIIDFDLDSEVQKNGCNESG